MHQGRVAVERDVEDDEDIVERDVSSLAWALTIAEFDLHWAGEE